MDTLIGNSESDSVHVRDFLGAARTAGRDLVDGSALASFGKSPLELFTFRLVESACFGQSAQSGGGRASAAYGLDPGAYLGVWT
jgi:hypothetical protein